MDTAPVKHFEQNNVKGKSSWNVKEVNKNWISEIMEKLLCCKYLYGQPSASDLVCKMF